MNRRLIQSLVLWSPCLLVPFHPLIAAGQDAPPARPAVYQERSSAPEPDATQSRPTDPEADEAEELHPNERWPNQARPPWTGPSIEDPTRPGWEERYRGPRFLPDLRYDHRAEIARLYDRGYYGYARHGYHPYGPSRVYAPVDFYAALDEAYVLGRVHERDYQQHRFNVEDMNRRKQRILSNHEKALNLGVTRLRDGDYARAIVALTLATELDQGDPASRIHLAQARMAQGHYEEAGQLIRRALQLQPKLTYADLHLERYYPTEATFAAVAERLSEARRAGRLRVDGLFLAGYVAYQQGEFDEAHESFTEVARRVRDDDATAAFLKITRPASAGSAAAPGRSGDR